MIKVSKHGLLFHSNQWNVKQFAYLICVIKKMKEGAGVAKAALNSIDNVKCLQILKTHELPQLRN
jgi:hypothetical protein